MVAKPEQVFNNLYPFLGIKPFKHQFQNLKQIEVNGIGYDDKVVGKNMHTIRTTVRKEINLYLDQIPERIKRKYGHIKF